MLGSRERPMPEPTYMSKEQQAQYLENLRGPPMTRPNGSRPTPFSRFSSMKRGEAESIASLSTSRRRPAMPSSSSMLTMPASNLSHRRAESDLSSQRTLAGRPLVQPPSAAPTEDPAATMKHIPSLQPKSSMKYMERGTRWMEKQEVRSVRMAMEDMDLEEERKLHAAAQDEAAELVWKHQHSKDAEAMAETPYANPDIRRDYREHLRKGSYQREHSQEMVPIISTRQVSGGDHERPGTDSIRGKRKSIEVLRKVSPPLADMVMKKTRRTPSGKSYGGLAEAVASDIAQAQRRISSGSKRILSGEKKMFMHPNDRIWEDVEEGQPSSKPVFEPATKTVAPMPAGAHIRKNPFARVRMQAEKLERSNSEPILTGPARVHNVEIQRNSPSQSKRPWYMSNEPLPPTPPSGGERDADEVAPKTTPTKEAKEIRGDDIRAATSKQRKDYSHKLPRPTVVSDKPGRPIVSFKEDWKPKEVVLEEVKSTLAPEPCRGSVDLGHSHTNPTLSAIPQVIVEDVADRPIPMLKFPDEPTIPSIVLPEEPEFAEPEDIQSAPVTPMICVEPPSISVEPPSSRGDSLSRSYPQAAGMSHQQRQTPARPLPHHSATSPLPKSTPHYSPSFRQSGALCEHCALPIAGRVLSAASQRFHPACFVCHQCNTNLELVAFYPEPENKRSERLARIDARQTDSLLLPNGTTEEEAYDLEIADGDPSPRFYCHLDFHELFSPRCRSCKTPIEGEVIVACGAEWHAGHFFCAQCGDPFDSKTPFVEKDKYAWCVGCYTNRYSSKCRGCKKPVTDTVVKALGFDWHGGCFVCMECKGEFEDGKYFLRGNSEDPVCVRCEQRRLKA